MKFRRTGRIERGWIDFVPFVNIVMLLTFFFLLTSSMVLQPGIRIDVPRADVVDLDRERDITIVSIAREGTLFVNEKKVSLHQLRADIGEISRKQPNRLIVIKADSSVAHDRVVEAMNAVIKAGAKNISIAARPNARS